MRETATDPALARRAFAEEVLHGIAALQAADRAPGALEPGELTVPLGLSAWITRAAIGIPDAYHVLSSVRALVIVAADLPPAEEPVPLRVADHVTALQILGTYLFELFGRAARHCGAEPVELAERALAAYFGEA